MSRRTQTLLAVVLIGLLGLFLALPAVVQAGQGFGVMKFHLVWVFDNQQALDKFVNSGWELGAQATASAKAGDTGAAYQGAVSVSPGVWLYQMTGDSLALELTAKGTKYYKDKDLN